MSAPNTNLERQKRNHKGPIGGITLALVAVAILFAIYFIWNFAASDGVEGSDAVIDSRTGEVEAVDTDSVTVVTGE